MSEVWSEGYFTEVGYTYGYYRETSPVFQRFCLLLRGLASTEPGHGAAHCELGFGQGVSVTINAAANPGNYVGNDFNPTHVAHAQLLARHSGRDPRLYDDSFEQLLARDDLPTFDSISLHGIWSWISRDNHRVISRFAARHLRPGGIFYVSYNCFPGWALAHPLRQLFAAHDRYAPRSAATARRIDSALDFSLALIEAGPLFAYANGGLDKRLAKIKEQNHDYLAHEYFNRDWNCMYFTEVADALAEAKLEFASTAQPLDVVDSLNLPAEGIAFLNNIEHPIMREQARDYFVNQQFRKDLYLRGARRLSPAEQREQALATRIVLEKSIETIPMKFNGAYGEAALQETTFRPLLEALAEDACGPKSLGELLGRLPSFSLPRLINAAAVLVGANHAAPCQSESAVLEVRQSCSTLNRYLLERARTRADIGHLASPLTGAGVPVGRFQQLFLLARERGCTTPDQWARFAWQVLSGQGESIIKHDRRLDSPEENLAELTTEAHGFAQDRLPVLKAIGVA